MISQNLKIIFISAILASSKLISADDVGIPPDYTSSTSASRNGSIVSTSEDPFGKLMRTINFLSVSNGKIEPWRDAILEYKKSLSDNAEIATLESIREKILNERLANRRMAMINRAFASLARTSPLPSLVDPPSISASVAPPQHLPPSSMHIILFADPISNQKPVLSSAARKQKISTLSSVSGTGEKLGSIEGNIPLVGQRAIPASVILENMRRFIAGQDTALESLSFLAHRFLCNKLLIDSGSLPASNPSHCILTGPTGCGKSESFKQLGRFLGVPILHINARSLTDEGFKGQNFSECVASFCEEYNNPSSAIVAIDEMDKLSSLRGDESKNFGRAVQRVLLSPLDGSPLSVKGKQFNLTNWWFIGTGAFSDLKGRHDASGDRTTTARTHKDIISAGFEPEFVGRFPSIIPFKGHTLETMIDVISRDNSPLKRIQNEFRLFYGVELIIEEAALRRLASTSIEINLGVRSLYTILNAALQPFYGQAITLMVSEVITPLNVTMKDITPAITQFVKDNKEVREEIPEHLRHLYI